MGEKQTTDEFEKAIEQARSEIAALQKRIHEMVARRKKREVNHAREAQEKSGRKIDPRVSTIDGEIAKAREQMRISPKETKLILLRIASLETERYRLLLTLEED